MKWLMTGMDPMILVFHLPAGMNNTELGKFIKHFYGQETSTKKGKYRYRRKGLLDSIPHRKLLRGVKIIRKSDLESVMKLLIQWNAIVDQRIIEPNGEDLKILQDAEE